MKKQPGYLRRLTALMLMLCMLAALTLEIFALDTIASGYCGGEGDGTNLTWTLNSEGTLTISGKGKMADFDNHDKEAYTYGELQPWIEYKYSIRKLVISNGITSIGAEAFCCGTSRLWQELDIPDGVISIGNHAFASTFFYGTLKIPDSVVSIGDYDVKGTRQADTSPTYRPEEKQVPRFHGAPALFFKIPYDTQSWRSYNRCHASFP